MSAELVKVLAVPVVQVREGGRVVREVEGVPRPCYGAADLVALWDEAEAMVAQQNAHGNGGAMREDDNGADDGMTEDEHEALHANDPAEAADPLVEPDHPDTTPDDEEGGRGGA